MFFKKNINTQILNLSLQTIEQVIHAPLEQMLKVCADNLSSFFQTKYTCIHFTDNMNLPFEYNLAGLKYCPVVYAPIDEQAELLAIEQEMIRLATETDMLNHQHLPAFPNWERFLHRYGFNSGFSIPLSYQQEVFAVIDVYNVKKIDYSRIQPSSFQTLGSCLYGAIKKETLIRSLQERDDIIEAFARTIEASDRYTGGHVDRVSKYALTIGNLLDFNSEQLRSLKRAALLHDIGKIGVSPEILNKPGPLTPEERKLMEQHPLIGKEIFGPTTDPSLLDALDGILYHHERLDGKGYPFGLDGDNIPLTAKIIAIADVWDALTTDRPYRKAMSRKEATQIMLSAKDSQLDGKLVDLFLNNNTN